jgi:uncharacterized protein involved in tolerance to divalent cations
MNLDKIGLPGFLFPLFYKNSLVDLTYNEVNNANKNGTGIDYLGGNKKNIIFLVNDERSKYLNETSMNFLNELLIACKLTMADIALLNFHQKKIITNQELTVQLKTHKIVIFGLTTKDIALPHHIPVFHIQKFQQREYLICPSLEELRLNRDLKKQLWNCFKKFFDI